MGDLSTYFDVSDATVIQSRSLIKEVNNHLTGRVGQMK